MKKTRKYRKKTNTYKIKKRLLGGGGNIYTDMEITVFNNLFYDIISIVRKWAKKIKKPMNEIEFVDLSHLQQTQIDYYIDNITFLINIDNKEHEIDGIFTIFSNLYDSPYSTDIETTGITNKILLEKYNNNNRKYKMVKHLFISKINRKRLAIFTDYSNASGVNSLTIVRRRKDKDIGNFSIIKYILENVDKNIENLMYQNIQFTDRETYSNQHLIDYYYLQQFINIE